MAKCLCPHQAAPDGPELEADDASADDDHGLRHLCRARQSGGGSRSHQRRIHPVPPTPHAVRVASLTPYAAAAKATQPPESSRGGVHRTGESEGAGGGDDALLVDCDAWERSHLRPSGEDDVLPLHLLCAAVGAGGLDDAVPEELAGPLDVGHLGSGAQRGECVRGRRRVAGAGR